MISAYHQSISSSLWEGKLSFADDVDCYEFSYIQWRLYERKGISSRPLSGQ